MMQTLQPFVALIVAIASGLAFLSYRHRLFYRRLSLNLHLAIIVLLFGVILFNVGNEVAFHYALPFIPPDKIAEATKAQVKVPEWQIGLGSFVLFLFLQFLQVIPEPDDSKPTE